MTNPHPTTPTDIDIRVTADQVIAQLQRGQRSEALRLLEQERANERPVVQEALDRYVAVGARTELDELRGSGTFQALPELASTLERLQQATQPPRMPDYNGQDANAPNELVGLTDAQKYDIYASVVEMRGNQAAFDALRNEESVLLGLRKETSTVASMDDHGRRGTGVYDDHIVVLRKDENGERHWFIADRTSTEPTAQYDEHAEPGPGRENTPYSSVIWRRGEGTDANRDDTDDLGRLAEGTIEMVTAEHPNPRLAETNDAFRPSPEQLTPPRDADLVQRDTNGDGWFTQNDVNSVQDLNRTFKIHSGSRNNTDSAGCQTIHPVDYQSFVNAAQANPEQTRWQYVLTSTEGGLFHNVNLGQEQDQPQQQPAPERNGPTEDRQGMHQPGPFNDPIADRYFAAVVAGDSDLADRIAIEFAQSPEGQQMAQQGDRWLAQQQALEQQQLQERQMAQQGPVMQM